LPSISVLLATARDDYPIIGLPDLHIFNPTFNSLLNQTFQSFEVIVVDALFPRRQKWLDKDWGFPVKYVPVHANHRFWLDRKRWQICGALNTGIIHAEGELLVRIDDCSEFESTFLEKFWDGYRSGYFPLAMHVRYLEGKPARFDKEYMEKGYEAKYSRMVEKDDRLKVLERLYGDEGLIRDTRYPVVKARGGRMIAPPDWFYGYSSLSLQAALDINGFNELFDGDKSQEDQEAGLRLTMAGYKNVFSLDVNHQVIEHEHMPIPSDLVTPNQGNIKCNYALFLLSKNKNRWRANSQKLTEDEIEFVRQESLKPPCSPTPNFYEDDCKGDLFKLWADHQPIFDLREERMLLG
jgi:glycosyltransferase involved in cell wall biosynthesis